MLRSVPPAVALLDRAMTDDNDSDDREYVYAIAHPHGFVKLGRSKDPQQRLRDHQISCPYELWMVVQFPVEDSRSVESQLHDRLEEKNIRGEWYELGYDDYDDLFDMVQMAVSEREFDSVDEFEQWQVRKQEALY